MERNILSIYLLYNIIQYITNTHSQILHFQCLRFHMINTGIPAAITVSHKSIFYTKITHS